MGMEMGYRGKGNGFKGLLAQWECVGRVPHP
jgi:hypothetical protein